MGLRIDVDASRGISSVKDFRKSLEATGVAAQLTEREIKSLEDRFERKLGADNAAAALNKTKRQIEEIGKAAGLTQREIMALGQKAGVSAVEFAKLGNGLDQVKSSASTATSAISSLESIVLKLGAAFAAYKVADYIKGSVMLAARYETLGVVMETVGANAGYTAGEMNATAAALQKTGISMVESRQQATKLVQAHLDLSKATDLARLAQDAAGIAGENSSATFARLVDAIQTAQPEMLRTVGLNVNFESSYKKLADQLGTTANALTENEKIQARFNAVMERGPDIANVYSRSMDTAGKALLSFERYSQNLQVTLGEAFGPALQQFVDQATISMKAFQDEISRPEAQYALGAMASGAANLGTNLMRSAVPALQAAITAINDFVTAWQKIPAPLQGAILGGGVGAMVSRGNPWAIGAGALYGMSVFGDAENEKSVQEGLARAQNLASSGTNQIRMRVAVVGPDGKPLGQTVKKQIEEAGYSASDSSKLLSGSGTAEYQLGETWKKNLGVANQLQRKIDSGRLSQEDLTRAINDQREAWGRIGDAQESYEKKMNRGSKAAKNAGLAAERFGSQAAAALEQAQNQQEILLSQLDGDSLGAKLSAIDKKYDASVASIRRSTIGAKGDVSDINEALSVIGQNRSLEKQIVKIDAWAKSMQSAASILTELGQLSGDPGAIYGGIMTSAQAWEADQKKRIGAIADLDERANPPANLTGTDPAWSDRGATNAYLCVDEYTNTQTENDYLIDNTFDVSRCDSIVIFGVEGYTLTIDQIVSETIIKTSTHQILQPTYTMSEYCFGERVFKGDVFETLLLRGATQARIRIDAGEGKAKVGNIIAGLSAPLGKTQWGAKINGLSYSKKTTDSFGRTSLLKGSNASTVKFTADISLNDVDFVKKRLADIDGIAALFVIHNENGIEPQSLTVYGWAGEFEIPIEGLSQCTVSFDVTGLI
ncbi:hypothetical protein [Solidesulfovibrio sp. C21]|uniref:hypothetical protein n=1 Tax=Solidesulfovibrio sp. C21 TaxID=3398613 RepID=UPI0039FB9760